MIRFVQLLKTRITRSQQLFLRPIHQRPYSSNASISSLKSIDNLPGDFEPLNKDDTVRLFTDPLNILNQRYVIAKEFDNRSPMVKMHAFDTPMIVLFSHDLIKSYQQYELMGKTQRSIPDLFIELLGKAFGDMQGKNHLEWRKKAMKSFKPDIVDQYTPFIQKSANDIVLSGIADVTSKTGEYMNFCELAKKFAFQIGIKFMLGPLLNSKEIEELFEIFRVFTQGLNGSVFFEDRSDPNSTFAKAKNAKEELNALLTTKFVEAEELIMNGQWKRKYEDEQCVLSGLIENDAVFDNGGEYGLYDKADLITVLTFAAYDTSATSLTNLIYAIHKHPEQADIVRKAIMNHPELSNPETVFSMDMLKSCNELECFIEESQRVYGIVPLTVRKVNDENGLDFGGYLLPHDTTFAIPIKWLHQGDGSWTESLEFKFGRFDKSNGKSKADRGDIGRYNNIPFYTGIHKCLGMHLALLEMKIYTTLLLRDWEFELDESKLNDEEGVTANEMNITSSIPHFNVHLKMRRRE